MWHGNLAWLMIMLGLSGCWSLEANQIVDWIEVDSVFKPCAEEQGIDVDPLA